MQVSRRHALAGMTAFARLGFGSALGADRLARFTVSHEGSGVIPHDALDELLGRYLRRSADGINRVDYAEWQRTRADREALDAYIAMLSRTDPASLTRPEQFA